MSELRLAIVQVTGMPFAPDANRQTTVDAVRRACSAGSRVVVLPELIIPGYVLDRERIAECAEGLDGPTVAAWTALAREFDAYIAGGFAESEGARLYNTAVVVGPDGPILHYRKLHLFDGEWDVFAPGDLGLPLSESPVGSIGACVCYDLRFPEVVRALALKGADLILVPTAWLGGFDDTSWDAEGYITQARGVVVQANLNQVFIACASQVGVLGEMRFLGSSLVADPYGKVAVGPLGGDTETVAWADVDPDASRQARVRADRIRPREDRRTDVYRLWVEGEQL